MKKILTIVGARPQFIKVASVSRVLRKYFQEILVHTGQHYDHNMSGVFFDELNIPQPDYNLTVGSGGHGTQTGMMMQKIEEIVLQEKPDGILVYGDTNSTLAGALVASKLHIPLVHIEAGLRSFNKQMPEEVNRILTDHISTILFAPTIQSVRNLEKENITENVHLVGDVMNDAVLYNMRIAEKKFTLQQFGLEDRTYMLVTIHRAENTDNAARLEAIFRSLNEVKRQIILPLHPRTKQKLEQFGLLYLLEDSHHIKVIKPVSYLEMLYLEKHANAIVTDSGGVQKEAYFAKKPCYTLREQTEWVETVESGWNILVDPKEDSLSTIMNGARPSEYDEELYGNGKASERIVQEMLRYFKENKKCV
ncbi:UDP-N-acetylglucosamine 2-epimerase (non-hydrolyzing) [Bacillus tianshenii]|nr:UDP-N-acetylglucosamine 2-epimerase (non-hydrolyzing) [Bacillus tianshenii]